MKGKGSYWFLVILWVCCGVSLIGLLTGCATIPKDHIAGQATDYNLIVEKAQNEMLLLNIVRASKRRPMYFTTFSKLSGDMSYSIETGSILIPFGKFGTTPSSVYSVSPKVSYSTKPLIEVAVLNAKDFAKGLSTPATLDIMKFYWDQGWPAELLLHLFVWKIELPDAECKNYPEDGCEDFQKKLHYLLGDDKKNCTIVPKDTYKQIGPKISAENAAKDLKSLIELDTAKLTFCGVKENVNDEDCHRDGEYQWYHLSSKTSGHVLECTVKDNGKGKPLVYEFKAEKAAKSGAVIPPRSDDKIHGTIYLRSPEAMLYYLGQIMRDQNKHGYRKPEVEIERCSFAPPVPLFVARASTDTDKAPYVSVNYEGVEYIIPKLTDSQDRCHADRSMYVLELISLLVAKQISSSDLPPPAGISIGH